MARGSRPAYDDRMEMPSNRSVMAVHDAPLMEPSDEEAAGLRAGLDEIDRGEVVTWEDARAELRSLLRSR